MIGGSPRMMRVLAMQILSRAEATYPLWQWSCI